MKFSTTIAFLAIASTQAFSPSNIQQVRKTTQLFARADSADLVAEALAASKEFGASSPEARLAWEAVEEVDSSDNSAATQGNVADYQSKLQELAAKLKEQQPAMAVLGEMAEEIKAVKLSAPVSKAGAPSAQLQEAMTTANEITEKLGVSSPEAQVAWEVVEEIAASGNSNAMGGMLSEEECLVDVAMEACIALEELNRALDVQNSKEE
eukprot:CAMPEP_0113610790 /NCGR_PEP_ID=MMETSP0017_2-20120614/5213_1 /TAXON_ID=2856 /ORGANISM="Cylindrotheca closterium" /LENGTH=208 /DNA_ID=CAMNT_0000519699 /DNA_START=86 /DNA_END=712 /DNA_ORIENTATION=- /assembly_acc=CAM_ASM_000147